MGAHARTLSHTHTHIFYSEVINNLAGRVIERLIGKLTQYLH